MDRVKVAYEEMLSHKSFELEKTAREFRGQIAALTAKQFDQNSQAGGEIEDLQVSVPRHWSVPLPQLCMLAACFA